MNQNNASQMVKNRYVIAGIRTELFARKDWTIEKQARDYLCDFQGEAEIRVGVSDEFIDQKHGEYPHLTHSDCEYMWSGAQFCHQLLKYNGFMLHASAVVYEGKAYLFSAPSGTGKSTHTKLWLEVFGEKAYILNDDKPVVRINEDGQILAYGTPWSGKTDQNRNAGVPLGGICFVERATQNSITRLDTNDAVYKILNQTIRPEDFESMESLLSVLDKVLEKATVYKMGCNISHDAVLVAYNGMNTSKETAKEKEE